MSDAAPGAGTAHLAPVTYRTVLHAPPQDFNYDGATQAELAAVGLPPRPAFGARGAPHTVDADLWHRSFSASTEYLCTHFVPIEDSRTHFQLSTKDAAPAGNWGTSLNWSGFMVGARDGRRIAGVSGGWTVPHISRPSPLPPTVDDTYRYSCWVGIDGLSRFATALPQIGIDGTVHPPADQRPATRRAWIQWFARVRGGGIPPLEITQFGFDPGNEIAAFATVRSAHHVDFAIVNLSRKGRLGGPTAVVVSMSIVLAGDAQPGEGDPLADYAVVGAVGEWILERPAKLQPDWQPGETPKLYALPRFDQVAFGGLCVQEAERLEGEHRCRVDRALTQVSMYEMRPDRTALRTLTRPRVGIASGVVEYWPRPDAAE